VELELVRLQFKIRSGFGPHLNKGREVALEAGQLQIGDFQNVVAHVVQQARVVRDHDASDVRETLDIIFNPLDVHHVQMVRGLVHEQNVGVLEHRSGKGELHAPASVANRLKIIKETTHELVRWTRVPATK
jgi:hypothetical protein